MTASVARVESDSGYGYEDPAVWTLTIKRPGLYEPHPDAAELPEDVIEALVRFAVKHPNFRTLFGPKELT